MNDGQLFTVIHESSQVSLQESSIDSNNVIRSTSKDFSEHSLIDLTISTDDTNLDISAQPREIITELTNIHSTNPINNKVHQLELMIENSDPMLAMIDKYRSIHKILSITVDKDKCSEKPPKEIFTLPLNYLPKKKTIKIEKTGKSKLSFVDTSDEWYKQKLKKEKLKNMKEEKFNNKKILKEENKINGSRMFNLP
ncbi:uncharacterized protein LOC123268991 [Cotesia glomerata]|uniref:uncharacterized protein LOC123267866 n=1 Tax=Cotesia glomerata TaxID=32391 RepID=UPI001D00F70C|nr:uncharacterized protein LOC123267866 [Cotesia glomerata]XP_044590400.1 uncharacterized protein LOC123268991 [Cotesia glomerata]